MALLHSNATVSVRLLGLILIGDEGKALKERVDALLDLLPAPVRLSTRVAKAEPSNLSEVLGQTRSELATEKVVEQLGQAGANIEGKGTGAYPTFWVAVGELEVLSSAESALSSFRGSFGRDPFALVALCDSVRSALEHWPLAESQWACEVVSPQSSGVGVSIEEFRAGVVGSLVRYVLPQVPWPSPSPGRVRTFGFSATTGLTGASLDRVASRVALELLDRQAKEPPANPVPSRVDRLLARWAPRSLGKRFFDSSLLPGVRPEPIPAAPEWLPDGTLHLHLDEGQIKLALQWGSENTWSSKLLRESRSLDMTRAAVWTQQLREVEGRLRLEIHQDLLPGVQKLLDQEIESSTWLRRAIETLEEKIRLPRRAAPVASADLQRDLEDLNTAIARRPNPAVLIGRMALWALPALYATSLVFGHIYPRMKGHVITLAVVLLGFAIGAGWVVWRILRARQRVIEARDQAVRTIANRQEVLLSTNAVAGLENLIGPLRGGLGKGKSMADFYDSTIKAARDSLHEEVRASSTRSHRVASIVANADEVEMVHSALKIDSERWLRLALEVNLLAGLGQEDLPSDWVDRLVAWCRERIRSGVDCTHLALADLWSIHEQSVKGRVWSDLADDLLKHSGFLCDAPADPQGSVLVLRDAGAPDELTKQASEQGAQVIHTDFPLFALVRRSSLGILQRPEGKS